MEEFRRLTRLPAYVFNITSELKAAARKRGEDIIDFGMGNPDGATPKHIVDKLIEASQKTRTHRYSLSKGIPRLRRAICNWYKGRYGVDLEPETEAIVTIGSKEGIAHLCLALLDDEDTVAVSNPSYPIHIFGPVIAGSKVQSIAVDGMDQISLLEKLDHDLRRMEPRPKILILNFPANPTTQCVDLPFFEKVVELCTLSKSYNMPGWRVGFMVGNKKLVAALARIKSYFDYGTFTPIQVASIAALEGPQDCVREICENYRGRRDVLVGGLNKLGWHVPLPKATMFVWAPIPEPYRALGSLEFSTKLLMDAKVAVSPGIGFGEFGDGHVRFSLIENEERTRQALRGIKQMFRAG